MTKKRLLTVLLMVMVMMPFTSMSAFAVPESVDLQYDDPSHGDDGLHKSPITIPEISLEDYTLFFITPCDGCTLRLLDANDNVVYSTVIATGTTSLVLPSTLSGEYEIQIIQGNICFYGFIYL